MIAVEMLTIQGDWKPSDLKNDTIYLLGQDSWGTCTEIHLIPCGMLARFTEDISAIYKYPSLGTATPAKNWQHCKPYGAIEKMLIGELASVRMQYIA